MRTIEEIKLQEPVFLNGFSDADSVFSNFDGERWDWDSDKKVDREGVNILFASYGSANYEGSAWVMYEKDGELYEVNGSHCSCYGLEDQWSPEEVLLAEVENRLINGTMGEDEWSGNNFKKELCEFLDVELKLNSDRW
jgi:hypothetical protein